MKITKSDISLELDCWIDDLSPAQLAAYEKVTNEHNAIKNALKSALTQNEGKELFNGQVFQAYSFKGKVLQEIKEATLPKKPPKAAEPPSAATTAGRGARKRPSNFVYLESSDEGEDDVPLAKRIGVTPKKGAATPAAKTPTSQLKKGAAATTPSGKASPQLAKGAKGTPAAAGAKGTAASKADKGKTTTIDLSPTAASTSPTVPFKPSEITSVGGLVIGNENKEAKESKENSKETKLQGKTFPSLVVLAKPWLKVKDMSATRSKLDSKVKLVLMLTPNKFTEWLIQEGLLRSVQKCANHSDKELKLGVYSDASKFPYTGGYVWISECCPMRFVSVFHGSIFEGAPHPPSCILKLIYHWSCQTNIQNVVQWVKVDNVYIKGVYTWLRAVCTLAVHQKCKKLGGPEKFVEVGVISLGTTSQDGQQRQVKVEVLGVLDYAEKTIRLRAVEPITDGDRNYKKRFQTILEPLNRWVHKDSVVCIDLTVDKMTLYTMGFKNIVQASATDPNAKHTNSAVMDYLRRIVPRMFQNTLSLLSRQMIQQFLDELVWREQFGTYALQAFNQITQHIAEQTRINTADTLTQRLYQVATNPFKDWSALPANYKEIPANNTPKRLKKPINEADYANPPKADKVPAVKSIKKEKETPSRKSPVPSTSSAASKRRAAESVDEPPRPVKRGPASAAAKSKELPASAAKQKGSPAAATQQKASPFSAKKSAVEAKPIKKENEDELKGLEECYYGVCDGMESNFEPFPYTCEEKPPTWQVATAVECPICDTTETFDSNDKLQTHLVSHIDIDGKNLTFQCLFCLDKQASESVLTKHNQMMHPINTKGTHSASFHCLICQQRFNTFYFLTTHMSKSHTLLELPYKCQACHYRTSSHRDAVRHFYDDHKSQNFLQCPFCLDIYRFCYKGKLDVSHIENYYMHLRQHVFKKEQNHRCSKCALMFIDKGALKQHSTLHHTSLVKHAQTIRSLTANYLMITPPKRPSQRESLPYTVQKLGEFYAFIDGSICAECNAEILSEDHFNGLMKCNKCNYKTSCERAIFEHAADCGGTAAGTRDVLEMPLPNEMHCICGFSTAIGNKMANHLANCGQKTAYPTVEMAQENTVKRNMLDMLGLVPRDGETGGEADGEQQAEDDADIEQSPVQQHDTSNMGGAAGDQAPIQFGESEATPIVMDPSQQQVHDLGSVGDQDDYGLQQYNIGFGQTEVQQHSLGGADIDMPLIGDLPDPNPPSTPQFLGEVHTPMFDAVAAAEQQHYYHHQ